MLESDDSNVIAYQDEVHFQLSTTITRKWALKGSAPKVKSHPGRQKASYSGYIIPSSGRLITTKPEWFNYETVIQSLRDFMRQMPDDGRRICLVVDNAPWHKKAIRLIQTEAREEYGDIRRRVELVPLPPYSPDLNPIEQVWRKTRKEVTHNCYFSNISELTKSLDDYFEGYNVANEELSSLCSFKYKN